MLRDTPAHCPDCGRALAPHQVSRHLRREHGLFLVGGRALPPAETRAAAIAALRLWPGDRDACRALEQLARAARGRQGAPLVAEALAEILAGLPPATRGSAETGLTTSLAGTLAARPGARAVTAALAAHPSRDAQLLALALALQLRPPVDRRVLRALRPLLAQRTLPQDAQVTAAAALLRTTGPDTRSARAVIRALLRRRSTARGLARLQALETLAGPGPALAEARQVLEGRVRMRCPRCGRQLRRHAMAAHLWDDHRLVLDGQRAREPWLLVEEWLDALTSDGPAREPPPAVLRRCRELARRADPDGGLRRLHRRMLARDLLDEEAQRDGERLRAEAARAGASLCPGCYAQVPIPRSEPPRPLSLARGRLSALGYRAEVDDRGLWVQGEIEVPGQAPVRLRPPGPRLTPGGAALAAAGPLVLLALAVATLRAGHDVRPLVTGLLLLALLAALAVRGRAAARRTAADRALDRALDLAWSALAPRLHQQGDSPADAAFLASLAAASAGRGDPALRRRPLADALPPAERLLRDGRVSPAAVAALRALALADAADDVVPSLAAELDTAFRGEHTLGYADALLSLPLAASLSPGDRARLRILAADLAFAAGYEVRPLIDAAATAPALATLLAAGTPAGRDPLGGLVLLRLLWSLRASRPWDRHGAAHTAFDLAARPRSRPLLARHPDLLLHVPLDTRLDARLADGTADGTAADLVLGAEGLVLAGKPLPRPPAPVEIRRHGVRRGRYELIVGGRSFRFDHSPDALVPRIEGWYRWWFDEFLPQAPEVLRWTSPGPDVLRHAWERLPCPECGRLLRPRPGAVAVAVATPAARG